MRYSGVQAFRRSGVQAFGFVALMVVCAVGFGQGPKPGDSEPPIPGIQAPGGPSGKPSDQPEIPKVEIPSATPAGPAPVTDNATPVEDQGSEVWLGLKQNKQGVLAGLLVAGICGYIGVYVVLKRIVF